MSSIKDVVGDLGKYNVRPANPGQFWKIMDIIKKAPLNEALDTYVNEPKKFKEVLELAQKNALIKLINDTIIYDVAGISDWNFFGYDKMEHNKNKFLSDDTPKLKHALEFSIEKRKKLAELNPIPEILVCAMNDLESQIGNVIPNFGCIKIKRDLHPISNKGSNYRAIGSYESTYSFGILKPIELYEKLLNMTKGAIKFVSNGIEFIKERQRSSTEVLYKGGCLGLTYEEVIETQEAKDIKEIDKSDLNKPISELEAQRHRLERFISLLENIKNRPCLEGDLCSFIGKNFIKICDDGVEPLKLETSKLRSTGDRELLDKAIIKGYITEGDGYGVSPFFLEMLKKDAYVKKLVFGQSKLPKLKRDTPAVHKAVKSKPKDKPPYPQVTPEIKACVEDPTKLKISQQVKTAESTVQKTKLEEVPERKDFDQNYKFLDKNQVRVNNQRMHILVSGKLNSLFEALYLIGSGDFKYKGKFYGLMQRLQERGLVTGSRESSTLTETGKGLLTALVEKFPDEFRGISKEKYAAKQRPIKMKKTHKVEFQPDPGYSNRPYKIDINHESVELNGRIVHILKNNKFIEWVKILRRLHSNRFRYKDEVYTGLQKLYDFGLIEFADNNRKNPVINEVGKQLAEDIEGFYQEGPILPKKIVRAEKRKEDYYPLIEQLYQKNGLLKLSDILDHLRKNGIYKYGSAKRLLDEGLVKSIPVDQAIENGLIKQSEVSYRTKELYVPFGIDIDKLCKNQAPIEVAEKPKTDQAPKVKGFDNTSTKIEEVKAYFYGFYLSDSCIMNENDEEVITFYVPDGKLSEDAMILSNFIKGKYEGVNWKRFSDLVDELYVKGAVEKIHPPEFNKYFMGLISKLPSNCKMVKNQTS